MYKGVLLAMISVTSDTELMGSTIFAGCRVVTKFFDIIMGEVGEEVLDFPPCTL